MEDLKTCQLPIYGNVEGYSGAQEVGLQSTGLLARSRLRDNHDLSVGEILTFQSVAMNDHSLRTARISTMAIS
jgi:hypothetical protein